VLVSGLKPNTFSDKGLVTNSAGLLPLRVLTTRDEILPVVAKSEDVLTRTPIALLKPIVLQPIVENCARLPVRLLTFRVFIELTFKVEILIVCASKLRVEDALIVKLEELPIAPTK
jgi:hypothetical protein